MRASADSVLLTEADIRGTKVPVYVHIATGEFRAQLSMDDNATMYLDETLEGLHGKLMAATKAKNIRVKVRFTMARRLGRTAYEGTSFRYGTAVGFHAATGHLMYRMDDGETGQWRSYNVPAVFEGILSDDEQAELRRLTQAQVNATRELDLWNEQRSYNLNEATKAAVTEAMGE